MRVLAIGASGTIGRPLCEALEMRGHEVVRAGRNGHDLAVDIRSAESIETMYKNAGTIDACLCVAESGALDSFEELTEDMRLENMRGNFFGQINLVLIGQKYLSDGGSFTLSRGILADEAWPGVTGGTVISGRLQEPGRAL